MKTVFFDVDTQLDFLFPAGALAVPGAQEIVKPVIELSKFAAANGIQIISTADAHGEDDPEFKSWKPHCIAGTTGQQKAASTLLARQVVLSTAPHALDSIRPHLEHAGQIIVEKQRLDCFTNPNLRPFLEALTADRYIVYGLVTELCVHCAAFGLLEMDAQVELVTDATISLNASAERETIQHFAAQGGRLTTVAAVIG